MNPYRGLIVRVLWLVLTMAAALFQSTWPEALRLQGVVPDLVLLLVVYFALADGEERAMYTGLIGGIYQDATTNAVLGHHVLTLVLVGYAVGRVSNRLVTEHPAIKAGLVLMAGVANGILYTGILYVQNPAIGATTMILSSAIPAAFYTALVTPVAFWLLARVMHRHEPTLLGGLSA